MRVQERAWEFAQPVHMCFVDLEKGYDHVTQGDLWVLFQEYGVDGLLLQAIQCLYCLSQNLVCISSSKSDQFTVRVVRGQGCPMSPVLFIIFMDRISMRSQVAKGVGFGGLWIISLLFGDYMVLLVSSNSAFPWMICSQVSSDRDDDQYL